MNMTTKTLDKLTDESQAMSNHKWTTSVAASSFYTAVLVVSFLMTAETNSHSIVLKASGSVCENYLKHQASQQSKQVKF